MTGLHVPLTAAVITACVVACPGLGRAAGLESRVDGLQIVALTDLPVAPQDQGDRDGCAHKLVAETGTAAGAAVAAKGWGVTGEASFGALTEVSFVGGYVQGTSGSCALQDGNLGLFAGDRLVALIYSDDAEKMRIGYVAPFGADGLRLWSGDYLSVPLADVRPAGGGTVVPLAAAEPVCGGAAEVPLIYGQPIDTARKALLAAGWAPVPHKGNRASAYGQAEDIAAAGVSEVQECSGTGFGYCSYAYAGAAGELSVTTAGEIGEDGSLPAVVDYGADCR